MNVTKKGMLLATVLGVATLGAQSLMGQPAPVASPEAKGAQVGEAAGRPGRHMARRGKWMCQQLGLTPEQQKKVDELTIINLKQKLQLKTLQESLWAATRERDFWVQKFHTTIHNTAQIIEMKSGIIDRQKKAIEQQNEMMIQYIRKLDIARKNANSPVIQDLPQD